MFHICLPIHEPCLGVLGGLEFRGSGLTILFDTWHVEGVSHSVWVILRSFCKSSCLMFRTWGGGTRVWGYRDGMRFTGEGLHGPHGVKVL